MIYLSRFLIFVSFFAISAAYCQAAPNADSSAKPASVENKQLDVHKNQGVKGSSASKKQKSNKKSSKKVKSNKKKSVKKSSSKRNYKKSKGQSAKTKSSTKSTKKKRSRKSAKKSTSKYKKKKSKQRKTAKKKSSSKTTRKTKKSSKKKVTAKNNKNKKRSKPVTNKSARTNDRLRFTKVPRSNRKHYPPNIVHPLPKYEDNIPFTDDIGELAGTTGYGEPEFTDSDIHDEDEELQDSQGERYEQARMAFLFGRYKVALRIWKPLANEGYPNAQATIAWMYHTGKGVKKNYRKAFYWYKRAANQSQVIAKNNLGVFYEQGLGVRKSYKKAVANYRDAAESGYAYAQYNLGVLYRKGRGIKRSKREAIFWLQIAALQGVSQAQDELAAMGRKYKIPEHQQVNSISSTVAWHDRKKTGEVKKTSKGSSKNKLQKSNRKSKKSIKSKNTKVASNSRRKSTSKKKTANLESKLLTPWVNKQNPNGFTIQLARSENLKTLHSLSKYIKPGPSKKKAKTAYYKTKENGKRWYSLLYGVYPSRGIAQKAIRTLPKEFREWSPWVRRFSDIQPRLKPKIVDNKSAKSK